MTAPAARGLAAARRATARVCTRDGQHRGQGLLLDLPGETSAVVLTCHHLIAPLAPDEVCVALRQEDGRPGVPLSARYDAARSRPGRDAAVLRVAALRRSERPVLHAPDPAAEDGGLPGRAIGLTYLQPDNFDARVAAVTGLVIPATASGRWPDAPARYELRAFRLADPTDARPGISGAVVVYRGGVLGLAHFARAAGPAHEREVYLVPLGVWAEGWPALGEALTPLREADPRPTGGSAHPGEATAVDQRALREAIVGTFSVEELAALCADVEQDLADAGLTLQVNLDMVGGVGKTGRVLNLIQYLDRPGHLAYLVRAARRMRPGLI